MSNWLFFGNPAEVWPLVKQHWPWLAEVDLQAHIDVIHHDCRLHPPAVELWREQLATLRYHPRQLPSHVIVLWHVDAMSTALVNALLKILEEPSTASLFLLHTENLGLVRATLLSRLQVWSLSADGASRGAAIWLAYLQDELSAAELLKALEKQEDFSWHQGLAHVIHQLAKRRGFAFFAQAWQQWLALARLQKTQITWHAPHWRSEHYLLAELVKKQLLASFDTANAAC